VADKLSPTALIPAGFGALLALCTIGAANRWKTLSAAGLVLMVAIALTVPF